jgi:hypothetical protein
MAEPTVDTLASHSLLLAAPAFFPALILVVVIIVIAVRDRRRGDPDEPEDIDTETTEHEGGETVRDDGRGGESRG